MKLNASFTSEAVRISSICRSRLSEDQSRVEGKTNCMPLSSFPTQIGPAGAAQPPAGIRPAFFSLRERLAKNFASLPTNGISSCNRETLTGLYLGPTFTFIQQKPSYSTNPSTSAETPLPVKVFRNSTLPSLFRVMSTLPFSITIVSSSVERMHFIGPARIVRPCEIRPEGKRVSSKE